MAQLKPLFHSEIDIITQLKGNKQKPAKKTDKSEASFLNPKSKQIVQGNVC